MKTYTPKATEIERKWWLVDAQGETLGRLASRIALLLRGKHRPAYTPHLDMGDYVVVVNAAKVAFTGNRGAQKTYYHHSGYPGGLREMKLDVLLQRHPERVLRLAVKGMLPRNRLGRQLLHKLKIHAGPEHTQQAQKPQSLPGARPPVRELGPGSGAPAKLELAPQAKVESNEEVEA